MALEVRIQIERLNFAYKLPKMVLKNINMEALPGDVTALIGPNASGKTTLLKCIAGILIPQGNISLDGKMLNALKKQDIATYMSYLPQEISSHGALSVFEAVLLGRLQSLSWRVDEETLAIVLKTLQNLEIEELALRFLDELSGGQRQMVWIAQALVRQPGVLLLDEPIHNLDIYHQLEILNLIRCVTKEKGIATIIVMHELNIAARYADKVVVLKDGEVYASGEPGATLTEETIRTVYKVNCTVRTDDGILQIIPHSLHKTYRK